MSCNLKMHSTFLKNEKPLYQCYENCNFKLHSALIYGIVLSSQETRFELKLQVAWWTSKLPSNMDQ